MLTINVLKRIDIFKGLSEEEYARLLSLMAPQAIYRELGGNETLFHAGDPMIYIFLLNDGEIKSINYTSGGDEIFFFYFWSGSVIGLVNAINGTNYTSHFCAHKKSTGYLIPHSILNRAIDEFPAITRESLKYISRHSQELVQLIILSRHKKSRDRLCAYLYMNYKNKNETVYKIPYTTELLAKRLNLTRPALSKELHQLEKEELIRIDKKFIRRNRHDRPNEGLQPGNFY